MSAAPLDPRALRDAFGAFMTGVTVVTALGPEGAPLGFTANSFASVSLSPPLLLVCIARTSRNFAAMTSVAGFAVNVLAEHQTDVSNTFARPVADRFGALAWEPGPAGSPVFAEAAAWFDCRTERVIEAGDHAILLGRVEAFRNTGRNGLGYARGSYFTAALEARNQAVAGAVDVSAVVDAGGRVLVVEDASGRWTLPSLTVTDGKPAEALARHLAGLCGRPVSVGFLFSLYDDRASGRRHVVYHAATEPGPPAAGRLVDPAAVAPDALATKQVADILRRYAAERGLGQFGVYVGNETSGQVHPLPAPGAGP